MSQTPPDQTSTLAQRLDAEVKHILATTMTDMGVMERVALSTFYPVMIAKLTANEAAALQQFRELCGMFARIAQFSLAELASTAELTAELTRRNGPPSAPGPVHS